VSQLASQNYKKCIILKICIYANYLSTIHQKKGSNISFMLKIIFIFSLIFNSILFANSLHVENEEEFYDLLPHSKIYIDKTRALTIKNILENEPDFKANYENILGFGYSPNLKVWMKFTLINSSDKIIHKVLEYANPLTTEINFYRQSSDYTEEKDGFLNVNRNRATVNPIFKIELQPHETQTYYLQASSDITTLIIKLHLYKDNIFYKKERIHQVVLALFFGAMLILALYNLFIFFSTKDISYLFYVLYIIGISFHHYIYVGFINVYYFNLELFEQVLNFASYIIGIPVLALALFTKYFLNIKQYKHLNKILNISIILFPLLLSIFVLSEEFGKYRNIFSVIFMIFLFIITLYAVYKKNRQAYFILFGKFIFLGVGIFMYLSSIGVFDIFHILHYYIEVALVLEALIFSIALTDRIKQLQKDKNEAGQKLIEQEKNETKRLALQVSQKTNDLTTALSEKDLLLKELNHRVKNNMQMIVSLIRLQSDDIQDIKLQELFLTIQNRINAMSHLHELLYQQNQFSYINAYEYFNLLIDEIRDSYESDIEIKFDITTDLKTEEAVYCGLILNELISNSFKHAFANNSGNISIKLYKENDLYKLEISDNGVGYEQSLHRDTLGLILINTLAKEQLKGTINTQSKDEVRVNISWSTNE